jgi:hypothetical protein
VEGKMNFFKKIFFSKYEQFAKELGYRTWSEASDNTFFMFHIPEDGGWYVTELPNRTWAVWNNEGDPPYSFVTFLTWSETIRYLRKLFNEYGYPETYWAPEGYGIDDDMFLNPPQKDKKL